MGGLLTRAIGGAMQGAGAAMVDQAKAAREDAIAALKRAGEVEDRDTKIAADAHNVATTQQAETWRAGMANQTSRDNAQGAEWTSEMNNIDNNETSRQNTKDTIAAQKGEVGGVIEGSNGSASLYTRGGKVTDTGVKMKPKEAMTDNEIVAKAIELNSTKVPGRTPLDPPNTIINRAGVAQTLINAGKPDLAKMVTGGGLARTPESKAAVAPPAQAPAAPPTLAKIPGLQFSPSKNQYRDPATNTTYDASGNPVQ